MDIIETLLKQDIEISEILNKMLDREIEKTNLLHDLRYRIEKLEEAKK